MSKSNAGMKSTDLKIRLGELRMSARMNVKGQIRKLRCV
jgi:hypothetical protein